MTTKSFTAHLTFTCPFCQKTCSVDRVQRGIVHELPMCETQAGNGGSRVLQYRVEYQCGDCGRSGWSRHCDMRDKLATAGFVVPPKLFPRIDKRQTLPKAEASS